MVVDANRVPGPVAEISAGIGRGLAEVAGASLNFDVRLISQEVAPRPQLHPTRPVCLPACLTAVGSGNKSGKRFLTTIHPE